MIPTSAEGVSVDAVHGMVGGMPDAPVVPVDAAKVAMISETSADAPKSGCFSCFGAYSYLSSQLCLYGSIDFEPARKPCTLQPDLLPGRRLCHLTSFLCCVSQAEEQAL